MLEDTAIQSVSAPHAVLHFEWTLCLRKSVEILANPLEVIRVYRLSPTLTEFLFQSPPGEIEPGLVEERMIVIRIRSPDHDRCRISHEVEPLLTLSERLFRSFTLGDVAPDSLKFPDSAIFIKNSIIHPLLPSCLSVPVDDLMFVGLGAWVLAKGDDVVYRSFAFRFRNHQKVTRADQFFTSFAEVPAVSVIDEGESRIRQIPADEIGLLFHNRPITLLTLEQSFLHPFAFSDVLDIGQ